MGIDESIESIDHVGLTVSDLERMKTFYEEVMGFDEMEKITNTGSAISTAVGVEDVELNIVFLDAGNIRLELLQYGTQASECPTEPNAPGTTHICIPVTEIETVFQRLRDIVPFISPPQTLESGVKIAYFRDPEENIIELLEHR